MSIATPTAPFVSDGVVLDAEQQRLVAALDAFGARVSASGLASGIGLAPGIGLTSASLQPADAAEPATGVGRGLYIHGPVGRGKTWLCDAFFDALPTEAKRRTHFHTFFRSLHESIWRNRSSGLSEPGQVIADAIAELLDGINLLYFDEFHVHDSGDAALITRVLEEIVARGVSVLATSNYAPGDLLPDADFHDLFEPGIILIERHLEVFELGGTIDYRRAAPATTGTGFAAGRWLTPGSSRQLADAGLVTPHAAEQATLSANGHSFTARRAGDGEVWFRFDELCEADSVVGDYLRWASVYQSWVVEGVPVLHTATMQARQRFANLIDVLADRNVTLHIVSEHAAADALQVAAETRDFERTTSRLALLRHIP
ncbi:cell division protein ZapE [Leifsonia sp. A12D58]|uniref:cell division protein ZapE n=1 Tax=Leifsonia sp. A12D58 TaxID=3397674 RepID=UPI0039DF9CCA